MNYWVTRFTEHDREYEARVTFDGLTFRIRTFLDGRPANRFEYSVSLETATEMETYTGVNAVMELLRTAQEHVRRGSDC